MTNVVLVLAGIAVALAVSAAVRRRGTDAPTPSGALLPAQIDRSDFPRPDAPWIVVVFTSAKCGSCAGVMARARVLESREVAVAEIEYTSDRRLHERYSVEAVPSLVVADGSGVVRAGFLGPVVAQDLWAAVAECREPGTTPRHANRLGALPGGDD